MNHLLCVRDGARQFAFYPGRHLGLDSPAIHFTFELVSLTSLLRRPVSSRTKTLKVEVSHVIGPSHCFWFVLSIQLVFLVWSVIVTSCVIGLLRRLTLEHAKSKSATSLSFNLLCFGTYKFLKKMIKENNKSKPTFDNDEDRHCKQWWRLFYRRWNGCNSVDATGHSTRQWLDTLVFSRSPWQPFHGITWRRDASCATTTHVEVQCYRSYWAWSARVNNEVCRHDT